MAKGTKPGFYAVRAGFKPGIYLTWDECEAQIKNFANARFKKFATRAEAEAFAGIASSASSAWTSGATSSSTAIAQIASPSPAAVSSSMAIVATRGNGVNGIVDRNTDVVYSDGACHGNGTKNARAGIGIWWGGNDPRNIAERCPGDQTNNRAELIAIVRVLETTPIDPKRRLLIKTDSQYSMNCITKWLPTWTSNAFRTSTGTPPLNLSLIRYLSSLMGLHYKRGHKVTLEYVKGHAGIEGNEGADGLANLGVGLERTEERDWEGERRRVEREMEDEAEDVDVDMVRGVIKQEEMLLVKNANVRSANEKKVEGRADLGRTPDTPPPKRQRLDPFIERTSLNSIPAPAFTNIPSTLSAPPPIHIPIAIQSSISTPAPALPVPSSNHPTSSKNPNFDLEEFDLDLDLLSDEELREMERTQKFD